MSRGYWSETDKPIRPGTYNRFKAAALTRIKPGKHGIVALIAKSKWGPIGEITRIGGSNPELDLLNKMGKGGTAYRLGRLALLGGPKELLVYRLGDSNAKKATKTIKGKPETTAEEEAIKFETKYETDLPFKINIKANPVIAKGVDLILLLDNKVIFSILGLSGKKSEMVKQINADPNNRWIDASVVGADKEVTLSNVVSEALEGGNSGDSNIVNEDYLKALSVIEGYTVDGLTLDGVTDEALITSLWSWTKRNRKLGNKVRVYTGAKAQDNLQTSLAAAAKLNEEGMCYVATGALLDGEKYSPAEMAAYIMGAGEGIDLKQCLCKFDTPFDDVYPRLTHEEIEDSIRGGVIVMVSEDNVIKIEDDVNTYKIYSAEHNEIWGNLRAIRFIDMVDMDLSTHGNKYFVGKVLNGRNGQLSILAAIETYFKTLVEGEIIEDYSIKPDERYTTAEDGQVAEGNQAMAASDEFYYRWDAKYINVLKKLFGTGVIR